MLNEARKIEYEFCNSDLPEEIKEKMQEHISALRQHAFTIGHPII